MERCGESWQLAHPCHQAALCLVTSPSLYSWARPAHLFSGLAGPAPFQPWNVIQLQLPLVRSLVESRGSICISAQGWERAFPQWSGLMAGLTKGLSGRVLRGGALDTLKCPCLCSRGTLLYPVHVLTWGADCIWSCRPPLDCKVGQERGLSVLFPSSITSTVPGT